MITNLFRIVDYKLI